jgi:cytochrome c556
MKSLLRQFVGLILVAGIAGTAYAQSPFAKPQDAIQYRQSAMFIMGQQFGRIAAVVKGKRPFDKEEVARSAAIVKEMSTLPWEAFVAGTDKGKTHAKSDIWTEAAKFKSHQEKLEQEAAKLAEVAKGGDLDAIKRQFGATGKACKSCHDDFKKKD